MQWSFKIYYERTKHKRMDTVVVFSREFSKDNTIVVGSEPQQANNYVVSSKKRTRKLHSRKGQKKKEKEQEENKASHRNTGTCQISRSEEPHFSFYPSKTSFTRVEGSFRPNSFAIQTRQSLAVSSAPQTTASMPPRSHAKTEVQPNDVPSREEAPGTSSVGEIFAESSQNHLAPRAALHRGGPRAPRAWGGDAGVYIGRQSGGGRRSGPRKAPISRGQNGRIARGNPSGDAWQRLSDGPSINWTPSPH